MEIRVLKYFIAVAEFGSVAAAARHVHVAQPSVSRQLRALERELGTDLFDRSQGALRLTAAGERFLPVAGDLVWRQETASRLFSEHPDQTMRFLVVAQATTEARVIAPFTALHGGRFPQADVVHDMPMSVFRTVDELRADIGVSTLAPPTGWEAHYLAVVPLNVQVPEGHPLAGRDQVGIAELVRHRLILMTSEHSARKVLDQVVTSGGLAVQDFSESRSSVMAQAAAASGRGGAVLTDAPAFGLRPVPIVGEEGRVGFPLYAGWKAHHYASAQIRSWAEELAAWIADTPEQLR